MSTAPRMTIRQFRELRGVFADKPVITAMVVLGGVGGALEALHILWLAFLWVYGRLSH
jgi:hypothetical protein